MHLPGGYAPFALGFLAAAGPGMEGAAALVGCGVGALMFMDFAEALSFFAPLEFFVLFVPPDVFVLCVFLPSFSLLATFFVLSSLFRVSRRTPQALRERRNNMQNRGNLIF